MWDSCSVTVMPASSRAPVAEVARRGPLGQPVGDHRARTSVVVLTPGERGLVVQVAQVELADDGVQLLAGRRDVDHDVVGVQLGPAERRVDDERRAVQPLGRAEHLAPEAVGDHHVVADGHAEQRFTLRRR